MRLKTPIELLIDWLENRIKGYGDPYMYDEIDMWTVQALQDTLNQALYLNDLHG